MWNCTSNTDTKRLITASVRREEYFLFPDVKAVLNDLYGMEPPALFAGEIDARAQIKSLEIA